MPYIEDMNVFKAVSFASMMIKKGKSKPIAISRAADYYGVNSHDVATELGKRGSSVSKWKKRSSEKSDQNQN